MMADNFKLEEFSELFPIADNLDIEVSDSLIADIKANIENKILNANIRFNADECRKFFDIDFDYRKQTVVWKNPDKKFIFGRAILYFKRLIAGTSSRGVRNLRKSAFCFGQVSEAEMEFSNGNIDYVNKICRDAGISFQPVQNTDATSPIVKTEVSEPKPKKTDAQKKAERMQGHKPGELPVQPVPVPSAPESPSVPTTLSEPSEAPVISGTKETDLLPDTEIPASAICPERFWDYRSACEVITAEPEPYLVEGLFRKGTVTIIGATQNAGKTTILFDLMGAVSTGSKFLPKPDGTGGFETHQGACILLDFEGDRVDTASGQRATMDTYSEVSGIEPEDIPMLVRFMPMEWIGSDKEFPKKVYDTISALPEPYNKPALIVFDTYSAFSDVENENESTQAQKVFNRFKELKLHFGYEINIFVSMHLRKLNEKKFRDVTMDDLRGTSAAAAAGSDIWFLSEVKDNQNTKMLKQVKAKGRSRSDEIKTLSLAYENNDDGSYSRVRFFMTEGTDEAGIKAQQTTRKQKNAEIRKRDILAFITTHPKCSVNRICKGDKEGNDRLEMNIKTCTPAVIELINEGKIYNLSDNDNYCLVINPNYAEENLN